jgi:type II secretory pathway pseudopilin PulG
LIESQQFNSFISGARFQVCFLDDQYPLLVAASRGFVTSWDPGSPSRPGDATLASVQRNMISWVYQRSVEPCQPNKNKATGRKDENMVCRNKPLRYTALIATVVVAMALFYLFSCDPYTVETTIVYQYGDQRPHNPPALTLDEEIRILSSPEVSSGFAQALYEPSVNLPESGSKVRFCSQDSTQEGLGRPLERNRKFQDTDRFLEWFSEKLSAVSKPSAVGSVISLRLSGEDPEFLKAVLEKHVRIYAQYRRALEARRTSYFSQVSRDPDPTSDLDPLKSVNAELEKLESQQRGCELALRHIKSNKGVFSGFVPASNLLGIPSVARFQQRIVDLEIKKRSLAVKFTSRSREIREVNLEIRGIKSAMKEYIAAHLSYLKEGRASLVARKQRLLAKRGPVAVKKTAVRAWCGPLPNGAKWFFISDGLYLLHRKPTIEERSLAVRVAALKKTVRAYLFSSPGSGPNPEGGRSRVAPQFACSIRDNRFPGTVAPVKSRKCSWGPRK